MAEGVSGRPWVRWAVTVIAGLVAGALGVMVMVRVEQDRRVEEDGVEGVAEVISAERPQRPIIDHVEVEVAFTTRDGTDVRTEVWTQQEATLGVIPVRYDPSHPSRALAVDDPVPRWWEEVAAAGLAGLVVVVLCAYPALVRLRDRLDAEDGRLS